MAGPPRALALAAPMPAPLFHRKGGDGVQELKLYTDVSSKSAFILKVGSGKAEKPVRLPKSDPLQKARSALDNAIPENLVDILSRWKPEQMDEVRRGCPNDAVNRQRLI